MDVTKELLEYNDFQYYQDDILKQYAQEEGIEYYDYERPVTNSDGKVWFISMRYNMSNTPHRDWGCHIDNCAHSTVAYIDLQTIEQFNSLMKIMDIEFRL